ncbi:MAG: UbiA family prenyltransferase [Deltaproteobacteria bacterium]|nr:UbiA family prenyltransferase [Deltaproteobacteria bacterium]
MKNNKKISLAKNIFIYFRMIKFSHTIFALPFALAAAILAWRQYTVDWTDIFWVLIAMTSARSAAMGFNRIADVGFDAKNIRTAMRAIPAKDISLVSAGIFVLLFSIVFIFASVMLGRICFYFAFPVLIILFSYSYAKRFTLLSHLYLGFVISLVPVGAWIALTNTFSFSILLLSLALMFYIAGFDIIYACQDIDFDRKAGLYSIPAGFGIKKALVISKIMHFFSFFFFCLIYFAFDMHLIYLLALFMIGILLIIEHRIVRFDDLEKIRIAFFHVNSIISVTLFMGILFDELTRRWI